MVAFPAYRSTPSIAERVPERAGLRKLKNYYNQWFSRKTLRREDQHINYSQEWEYLLADPSNRTMPHAQKRQLRHPRGEEIREVLTLREATLLADVPESKVRKDIETGLLSPIKSTNFERLLFRWADIRLAL